MRNTKISPETQNKINRLRKQLLTATRPAPELSNFLDIRKACKDAKELAADAPEETKPLTPQFVSLLSQEQRRSMEASSNRILLSGFSTGIKILAVEVIAKLAGPSLVREYEATESLHRLTTVLAHAVTTTDTQIPASRALGEVALVRPEAVADSLAQEEIISNIVTATGWPHIDRKNIDQTLFRLLVVLTERCPSQISSSDTIMTGAEAAVLIKLLYAQKLATNTRIREEEKSLSESELMEKFAGSGPTDTLTEYIHSAVDRDDDAAQILGKVVAASDVTGRGIPLELVNRVRSTEGYDREKAAQVLGEVVAVDGATAQEKSKELVNRVQSSDYGNKKRAAIALGEIAVAGDATAEEVPQELVNRVQSETGVDRVFVAGMLGRVVAAGREHTKETFQELVDKVRFAKKGSSNREKEAQTLGVVVAASDVTDQEIPLELVNRVRSSEGKNRRRAARVLAEVVAEKRESTGEITQVLVDQVRSVETTNAREISTEVLGEVVAASNEPTDGIPQALVKRIRSVEEVPRSLTARALGEIVAAGDLTVQEVPQELINRVQSMGGVSRTNAAKRLGEVVAVSGVTVDKVPRGLVNRAHSAEHPERIYATKVLGEAVAESVKTDQEVSQSLANRVRTTEGNERKDVAKVLGEVVAARDVPIKGIPRILTNRLRSREGFKRGRVAQVLGEVVAAGDATDSKIPQTLINRVQSETGAYRVFAAEMLGEVVAQSDTSPEGVPQVLIDIAQSSEDAGASTRRHAAWALGTVVAGVPSKYVQSVCSSLINSRIYGGFFSKSEPLSKITKVDGFTLDDLLTALNKSAGTTNTISPYLEAAEPGRRHVLKAIATGLAGTDNSKYPHLRKQIQLFLNRSNDIPISTRLTAVNILVELPC